MKATARVIAVLLGIALLSSLAFAQSSDTSPTVALTSQKLSEEVADFLQIADDEDTLEVLVIFEGIDENKVLDNFAALYKDQYDEYIRAKESEIPEVLFEIAPDNDTESDTELILQKSSTNDELLQTAIETKRALFREEYSQSHQKVLENVITSENILFLSEYSPMGIFNLNRQQILSLLDKKEVQWIEQHEECEAFAFLSKAYQTATVTYLRDTCWNRGSGVKIGMVDAYNGIPDITDSELSSASIIRYLPSSWVSYHATQVAKLLVGSNSGVSPDATLYCNGFSIDTDFYEAVEYQITQGVNIINCSSGFLMDGTYDILSQWVDHIARQDDVHFISCTGNTEVYSYNGQIIQSNPDAYVVSPGTAYNAITVGGYYNVRTVTDSDDLLWSGSCYREDFSGNQRAEKPNLVAPASALTIPGCDTELSGTSLATPIVAGVVADLCSYYPALKTKQTAIGAILEASSVYKLMGTLGSGVRGDDYSLSSRLSGTTQISKYEGAGKLNAKAARHIVSMGQFWGGSVSSASFPYDYTVYIDSSENTLIRVAIYWLRRNSLSGNHATASPTVEGFSNLNLQVFSPSGQSVGASNSTDANFEIVQFVPLEAGYYTIRVYRNGGTSTLENLGIAVY